MHSTTRFLLAAASLGLATACNTAPFEGPATTVNARTTMQTLSDAQSARVLSSLNMDEISAAQALRARSQNDDARNFASQMITEHSQAESTAQQLVTSQGITPVSTDASRAIDADAARLSAQLSVASVALLDSTYLSSQVDTHQQALELIDCAILPGAQNPTFKTFVQDTLRPQVQAHLSQAQALATGTVTSSATTTYSATNAAAAVGTCAEACTAGTPGALSPGLRTALCR